MGRFNEELSWVDNKRGSAVGDQRNICPLAQTVYQDMNLFLQVSGAVAGDRCLNRVGTKKVLGGNGMFRDNQVDSAQDLDRADGDVVWMADWHGDDIESPTRLWVTS